MTKIDRPDYCCGKCPELMRGGYDCTCRGNPRCKKNKAVNLRHVLDLDAQATDGPWEAEAGEVSQHWTYPEPWATIVSSEVECSSYCYGGTARGIEKPEDAELIAYYRTAAPAMAKALQAVLDLHVMYWDGSRQEYVCRACQHFARWPTNTCPTVQPILEHLGEQE